MGLKPLQEALDEVWASTASDQASGSPRFATPCKREMPSPQTPYEHEADRRHCVFVKLAIRVPSPWDVTMQVFSRVRGHPPQ